jgi:hypothetical protein
MLLKLLKLDRRLVIAILAILMGISGASLFPKSSQSQLQGTSASFPAVTCPSVSAGALGYAYLPSSKIAVRSIKQGSVKSSPSRTYRYPVTNPLLVDGNAQTTIFAESSNGWWASTICSAGLPDAWFVGGSAGLSSTGYVDLINSGLSDSIVELTAYAPAGARAVNSVTVPANSESRVSLDTLAPGDDLIAVHVLTRSGRIAAFLFDSRKKGLRSLGAEFVPATGSALTQLVIPGLANSSKENGAISHSVRILVPGSVDATVNVTINSLDGSFTPIGLDNLKVAHGQLVDIPLTNLTLNSPFTVVLDGDTPLLAGVLSQSTKGGADIAWAGGAVPLPTNAPISINVGGHNPVLSTFGSGSYEVNISYALNSGALKSATLHGSGEMLWRAPAAINRLTVTSQNKGIYAGLAFTPATGSGLSYMPLAQGATLQASLLPRADARVISRGQ